MSYGTVLGAGSTTVATAAALTLPNTGNSLLITAAISVAAGLLVWGALYVRNH